MLKTVRHIVHSALAIPFQMWIDYRLVFSPNEFLKNDLIILSETEPI